MAKVFVPSTQLTTEDRWTIVTGLALILMAVTGGFAYGYAHPLLHLANDAEATTAALQARPILLNFVVVAWIFVALLDLFVSYGIYLVYRRSAPVLSLFVAAVRVVYALVLIVAVAELPTLLVGHGPKLGLSQFNAFEMIWSGGLVVFGIHLLLLSRLVGIVGHPSRFVAVLLALGGLGYVMVKGTAFLGHDELTMPAIVETALSIPMALGELFFAICLLIPRTRPGMVKGLSRPEGWSRRARRVVGLRPPRLEQRLASKSERPKHKKAP